MTLTPHHQTNRVTLYAGDCLDVLAQLPPNSVHAVITDPPYGLEFMGKDWDKFGVDRRQPGDGNYPDARPNPYGRATVRYGIGGSYGGDNLGAMRAFQEWCQQWAAQCLRVLKPGGHLLAFGGTRTHHRLTCGIEDAGFEIRDTIAWLYGSGFPKSLDVSKAIDKAAGAEREVVGKKGGRYAHGFTDAARDHFRGMGGTGFTGDAATIGDITAPATPTAQQWDGWGTALKPAHEPIVVARKPLASTVAANVLAHGTGALNIDACRVVGPPSGLKPYVRSTENTIYNGTQSKPDTRMGAGAQVNYTDHPAGRWPANVALDGSQADALDQQTGQLTSGSRAAGTHQLMGYMGADPAPMPPITGDTGGASRFFPTFRYTPKAPTRERPSYVDDQGNTTSHPTVKPVDLFAWLIRLVVPPDGTFIDPFAGSGPAGEAATLERVNAILIEKDPTSLPLITARLHPTRPRRQAPPPAPGAHHQPDLFEGTP